jgi:hypothetical protein
VSEPEVVQPSPEPDAGTATGTAGGSGGAQAPPPPDQAAATTGMGSIENQQASGAPPAGSPYDVSGSGVEPDEPRSPSGT